MTAFGRRSLLVALFAFCTGPATSALAAPDNTLGTAMMFATVFGTGTLVASSGVTANSKAGTGMYDITFDRDVTDCAHYGTIRDNLVSPTATLNIPPPQSVGMPANRVRVYIHLSTGAATDRGFHLLVFCAR